MAEETTAETRVFAMLSRMEERQEAGLERLDRRIDGLREEIQAWRQDTHGRLSRLEGGFDQMDKRQANTESLQRWAIGLIITSWLTLVGLSITMLFKMP